MLLKRSQKLRARKRGGGCRAWGDAEAYVLLPLLVTVELSLRRHYYRKALYIDCQKRQVPWKCDRWKKKAVLQLGFMYSKCVEAYALFIPIIIIIIIIWLYLVTGISSWYFS